MLDRIEGVEGVFDLELHMIGSAVRDRLGGLAVAPISMKPTIYLETSVVSYLASRPSRDLVVAAHQQITAEWWQDQRERYALFCSELVLAEASAGDAEAAARRLAFLERIPVLEATDEARQLAQKYIDDAGIPPSEPEDAAHVAIATVHGMAFLLTWNCAHIANAHIRVRIESVSRASGYEPPSICTPEELPEATACGKTPS